MNFSKGVKTRMKNKLRILTAAILATLLVGFVYSLGPHFTFHNTSQIETIGVAAYSDSDAKNEIVTLDWGIMRNQTGAYLTKTIYIKNIGTAQITLDISTNNWSPTDADTSFTFACDQDNTILNVGATTEAILTLTLTAPATFVDFSFDIVIVGT